MNWHSYKDEKPDESHSFIWVKKSEQGTLDMRSSVNYPLSYYGDKDVVWWIYEDELLTTLPQND